MYGVQKVKSALQHIVLAPWRSGPVGTTFYNPVEVSSVPSAFLIVFEKEMFALSPKNTCERSSLSLAGTISVS